MSWFDVAHAGFFIAKESVKTIKTTNNKPEIRHQKYALYKGLCEFEQMK